MTKHLQRSLLIAIVVISCTPEAPKEIKTLTPTEIKTDEAENVVSKSFISLGRPVIRPTIVEVEKDKKAVQDGFMIYLSVKNQAKLTTYNGIKFQVIYLDKKGNEQNKETITVNKTLKPGDSINFESKLRKYKETAYKVVLLSANSLK